MARRRPIGKIPKEERYGARNHDFKVFIFGQDVTHWVQGSPNVSLSGHGGQNSVSISLENPNDIFSWTYKDLRTKKFNTASGRYSERAKATIFNFKSALRNMPYDRGSVSFGDVSKEGVVITLGDDAVGPPEPSTLNGQSVNLSTAPPGTKATLNKGGVKRIPVPTHLGGGSLGDSANTSLPIQDVVFPLSLGTPIFGKYDPIKIFKRWPYTEDEWWYPAFTGLLSSSDISDDAVEGGSVVQLSASCIREALGNMRVQTNNVPKGSKIIIPEMLSNMGGNFQDLILRSPRSHTLGSLSYRQIVALLTFGHVTSVSAPLSSATKGGLSVTSATPVIENLGASSSVNPEIYIPEKKVEFDVISNRSRVGRLRPGCFGTFYDTKNKSTDEVSGRISIEDWHALCVLGVATDTKGNLKKGKTLCTAQNLRSTQEMVHEGSNCVTGGAYDPWRAFVHLLVPAGADSLAFDLFENSFQDFDDKAKTFNREWSTRLSVLNEISEHIDYHFWVSGSGDLIFEFPQYDFMPCDYGKFSEAMVVDKQLINSGAGDESGDIPSVVSVVGGINWVELAGDIGSSRMLKAFAWSPALIVKYGINEKTVSKPFITQPDLLEAHARLELQKAISQADKLSASFVSRPFLTPNRPFFVVPRMRIGTVGSVSYTLTADGSAPDSSVDLDYVKRGVVNERGEIAFRFITAGFTSPIPYNQLYLQNSIVGAEASSTNPQASIIAQPGSIAKGPRAPVSNRVDMQLTAGMVDCTAARLPGTTAIPGSTGNTPGSGTGGVAGGGSASSGSAGQTGPITSELDKAPWRRKSPGLNSIPQDGVGKYKTRTEFVMAMQRAVDLANATSGIGGPQITIEDLWPQIRHETSGFKLGRNSNLTGVNRWEHNWKQYKRRIIGSNGKRKGLKRGHVDWNGVGMLQLDPGSTSAVNKNFKKAKLPPITHPAHVYSHGSHKSKRLVLTDDQIGRIKSNDGTAFSGPNAIAGMEIFDVDVQLRATAFSARKHKRTVAKKVRSHVQRVGNQSRVSNVPSFLKRNGGDLPPDELVDALGTLPFGGGGVVVSWVLDGVCSYPINSEEWKRFYKKWKNRGPLNKYKKLSDNNGGTQSNNPWTSPTGFIPIGTNPSAGQSFVMPVNLVSPREVKTYAFVGKRCKAARNKARFNKAISRDMSRGMLLNLSGVGSTVVTGSTR